MRYIIAAFLSLMFVVKADAAAHKLEVVIYTIPECPWCNQAKAIVKEESVKPYVNFTEIDLTGKPAVWQDMIQKTGGNKNVPQVFINGKYIGGLSDLQSLDLKALANSKSQPHLEDR